MNTRVSPRECAAMRLLNDEWSHKELAMCFCVGEDTVGRHVRGECTCAVRGTCHVGPDSVDMSLGNSELDMPHTPSELVRAAMRIQEYRETNTNTTATNENQ